jgi:hypothetical protein
MEYPRAIRVDSRYRSSGDPTAFSVQLPRTVEFPPETMCYVSAVSLPVAWFNVDTNFSDKLYVREIRSAGVRCRVITLDAGNYTSVSLPTALAEKLNTDKSFPTMAYTVTYVGARGCLLIQLSTVSGQAADSTARFQFPSEDELLNATWRAANWTGTADPINPADLDTIGDLLRLPLTSAPLTSMETGLLNVSPTDTLYLHSNLCDFGASIGPRGESDQIQRIPVDVSYGFVLHYIANGANDECFPVRGSYNELTFRLCNVRGRTVDLHGGFMSIELTFAPRSLQ